MFDGAKGRGGFEADAEAIWQAALAAVDPCRLVRESVERRGDIVPIAGREFDLAAHDRVFVVSFGKAAAAMGEALAEVLDERLTSGLVVVPWPIGKGSSKLEYIEASHPIPPLSGALKLYVLGQFVAVLLATIPYLQKSEALGPLARVAGAVAISWSLLSLGGLLDRRPWAVVLEAARLAGLALSATLIPLAPGASVGVATLAAASVLWLAWATRKGLPLPAELR